MRQGFENPRLTGVTAKELPLSRPVLVELMQAVLAKGVPFRFRARGWSMTPFIRDGDVITVSPLRDAFPRLGEVVAFIRPEDEKLVVHRVIARNGTSVSIQGDQVDDCLDEAVPLQNLLGRVTRIERSGRAVRLGLGPERIVIAWLSRAKLLIPLRLRLATWLKRFS